MAWLFSFEHGYKSNSIEAAFSIPHLYTFAVPRLISRFVYGH